MISFQDETDAEAHSKFQTFRREHPTGFVLNLKSASNGMLHFSLCDHMGDTEWLKEDGASLTSKNKVCSETKDELVAYAQQHGINIHECQHCKP
jgi:hypothetical protein